MVDAKVTDGEGTHGVVGVFVEFDAMGSDVVERWLGGAAPQADEMGSASV